MALTKLTRHWKVRDQIDIVERLQTKLKYGINDKDQICNLLLKLTKFKYNFLDAIH